MNAGDTGFMLICSALVFFMTPGLAFFYGGLVRRKNVVSTMMACAVIMGLSVVMWVLFGYSLSFGGNHAGIIGDFRWFGLHGIKMNEAGPYASTIPHLVYIAFQMMFAMITPALITGSLVGRVKFKALFLFIMFWSVIVYYPMAHNNTISTQNGLIRSLQEMLEDFLQRSDRLILPEEMWYISVPVSVHWYFPLSLAGEEDMNRRHTGYITFRL